MKPEILGCKEVEHSVRLAAAVYMGDDTKIRKRALGYLVILRRLARAAHEQYQRKFWKAVDLERAATRAENSGVTCAFTKPRLEQLWADAEEAREEFVRLGEQISATLDVWQCAGATFENLCNLCNRNPEQLRAELKGTDLAKPFSMLAAVEHLDYKDPRGPGWISERIDAPFTHALREYLVWNMLHSDEDGADGGTADLL